MWQIAYLLTLHYVKSYLECPKSLGPLEHSLSIYNNRTGFDLPSDRPYLVQPARSTPSPLTRLPSGVLCFAGEMGEWGRGADTAVYPTTAATHHSNLKKLMIPYQLLQQQAGRRGATLQHVDSVGIGRHVGFDTQTLSRRVV